MLRPFNSEGFIIVDAWEVEGFVGDAMICSPNPSNHKLDRGMEYRDKFRAHVRGRINYLQSGEYKKQFKTDVATIAYATTGQTAAYRVTRQKAMCTWIKELLKDMRLEAWAGVFKVASVEFQTLYDPSLFESEVWFRPDSETPVRLFD